MSILFYPLIMNGLININTAIYVMFILVTYCSLKAVHTCVLVEKDSQVIYNYYEH